MTFTPVWAASSWSDLRIVIWPASGGSREPRDLEADLLADVHQQRLQVERDRAVAGRDVPARLVLEQRDQLLVHDAVDVLPELLDARPLEQPVDALDRRLAQCAGDRRGQPLEVRRELVFEQALRVGVRVELVDDVGRERQPDVVVLEEVPLVSTHASVSSAWRFTQTVSEPTKTISVPSAKSTQAAIVRMRGLTAAS